MKASRFISAIILAAVTLAGCQRLEDLFNKGEVNFSSRTSGCGLALTRAGYSGTYTEDDKTYYKIIWEAGDKMTIGSEQAAENKALTYKVDKITTQGNASNATLTKDSDIGLRWGSNGDYTFYAVSPSTNYFNVNGTLSIFFPVEQVQGNGSGWDGDTYIVKPNSAYMYMTATETVTKSVADPSPEVNLDFQFFPTVMDFILSGENDMTIKSIGLQSSQYLSGKLDLDLRVLDDEGYPKGVITNSFDKQDKTKAISIQTVDANGNPIVIQKGKTIRVCLFLPAYYEDSQTKEVPDLTDLKFSVTFLNGDKEETLTTALKKRENESSEYKFLSFKNHQRHIIKGLILPDTISWEIEGEVTVTPWDETGEVQTTSFNKKEDTLPGLFSVSNSKKVYFSRGNLWTNSSLSPQTWSFEDNQYDSTPTSNGNYDVNHISHFYWTDQDNYGSGLNLVKTSAASVDWGKVYCESRGITPDNTWRTLSGGSGGEWEWLLGPGSSPKPGQNCRTASKVGEIENARYAKVTINGITGLLIFPDEFTWPTDVTTIPTTINTYNGDWSKDKYSLTDFSKLESAGCVFLPAAGYRDGKGVVNILGDGYYWTTTFKSTSYSYNLHFGKSSVGPDSNNANSRGFSVRLVKDYLEFLPHYIEKGSDYGPGVRFGSTIWAPVNCGIGKTDAEHPDGEYPNGLFYQWARKYGHSSELSEIYFTKADSMADGSDESLKDVFFQTSLCWYEGNTKSDTWLSSYDPCPDGWRVPTVSELNSLVSSGSTWDTTNKARVYGTSPYTISLVAVGYIGGSTGSVGYTDIGWYWSSSPASDIVDNAMYLKVREQSATSITYGYNRSNAGSVRCVYDK